MTLSATHERRNQHYKQSQQGTGPMALPAYRRDYCVVYRKGGTDNFTWHRSVAMSEDAAREAAVGVRKMGYPALVVDYKHSVAIGLPDTYAWQS